MTDGQTCANCRAFDGEAGECRRHAPVLIPGFTGKDGVQVMTGLWPETEGDQWCLEWVPPRAVQAPSVKPE